MIKRSGFMLLALAALLILVPVPRATAGVHWGFGVQVAPSYPVYPPPYYYNYPAPYDPYAYPAYPPPTYYAPTYIYPYSRGGGWVGGSQRWHGHDGWQRERGHERHSQRGQFRGDSHRR
jgi:hypothetical protein